MIHVFCYVALAEFRVSLIIYKRLLEFKVFHKFAPLLNILLSFKLGVSFLDEPQEVFELFGVEKLLTIYYIKLKKMECATMLFRVKRQITKKIWFVCRGVVFVYYISQVFIRSSQI